MTAQILYLPDYKAAPDTPAITLARSLTAARDALQHPDGYSHEQMREICRFLMAYGNDNDALHAEVMLILVSGPKRPERPTLTDYRAEALPVLAFAVAAVAFLGLFLGLGQ